ncbi:hypothetical protein Bsph_1003 [Lysinibacillus sphaericus C3-41]|uniref:Uncharacterized protein n=1 Tax=Lysinibacillus sphaericus (strain C3-41) TaxID=444177 RepID=B1HM43_LYSSC|nr:hypothetical protein Bsph_1003 [Lysinibacillus sphaericus C3-41]
MTFIKDVMYGMILMAINEGAELNGCKTNTNAFDSVTQ